MPGNAWSMVKRIIQAYGAAQDDENATVDSVAKLAGIHRPIVSNNNNFLRSIGILEPEGVKLTAVGVKLATGFGIGNGALVTEALQEIIGTIPTLTQLINVLRARGTMNTEAFRGQVILATGLTANSPNLTMVKTLLDLLEESQLTEIQGDKIMLRGNPKSPETLSVQSHDQLTVRDDALINRDNQQTYDSKTAWVDALLSKFPQFDPSWSEEVKLKWFDAFDRLMKGRGV